MKATRLVRLACASLFAAVLFLGVGALLPGEGSSSAQYAPVKVQSAQAATRSIAKAKVTGVVDKTYTGTARGQSLKVKYGKRLLKRNVDYKVSYKNNLNVGRARVYVKGMGKYSGKVSFKFSILPRSINSSLVKKGVIAAQGYTGSRLKPVPSLKLGGFSLKKNRDFTITYANNVELGWASATLQGKGNFTGQRVMMFRIGKNLATQGKLSLYRTKMPYTGKARKVAFLVTFGPEATLLKEGVDFTTTYANNVKVGTATVTVTGKGDYAASLSRTYKITQEGGVVLDVSEWQETIGWDRVAPRIDLAILRSYVMYSDHSKSRGDLRYDEYATSCEENGILYGTYGFMNFNSKADACRQARELWNVAFSQGHKPLFIVLDLETSYMKEYGSKIALWAGAAADELQACAKKAGYKGVKMGLYVGAGPYVAYGFGTKAGQAVVKDKFQFLWVPAYGTDDGSAQTKYEPALVHDMWQYTSKAKLAGVSTYVDLSIIRRSGPFSHTMGWYLKR